MNREEFRRFYMHEPTAVAQEMERQYVSGYNAGQEQLSDQIADKLDELHQSYGEHGLRVEQALTLQISKLIRLRFWRPR